MSRDISATNLAEINASHLHPVVMVHLAFDTPVYVHSNIGAIQWDPTGAAAATGNNYKAWKGAVEPAEVGASGNEYQASKGAVEPAESTAPLWLGMGNLGSIGTATETETLRPTSMILSLSGINSQYLTEALDAGNYGDIVTIYEGYRNDDGTLVDDPWIIWKGFFEYATIIQGQTSSVQVVIQHDLNILEEIDGGRYTDEDQQQRFAGDDGFKFISDMATITLEWGSQTALSRATGGREPWRGSRP